MKHTPRRSALLLFALLLTFILSTPGLLHAWTITHYASDIAVELDGSISVKETISVDFSNEEKHGIFRDLPVIYNGSSERVYTDISDIVVTQDGTEAITQTSTNDANMRIRIGDPDETISGEHTYDISYTVQGVLQRFDEYDELYWNVTGNGWDAPMQLVSASVTVPAELIETACYKGSQGSTNSCDTSNTQAQTATFTATDLGPHEGLTVAVGFTRGVVPIVSISPPPTLFDALFSPMGTFITVLVTLIGLGFLARHWYLFGRDRFWQRSFLPGVRSDRDRDSLTERILPLSYRMVTSVEYQSPDDLRPAEIGLLLDERADTLDVSATIVDLASRGFLEITEVPKKWIFGSTDYTFTRTSKPADGLLTFESTLLSRLFDVPAIASATAGGNSVDMSDLKNSFYSDLKIVKKELYQEVVHKGLFPASPDKVRILYVAAGLVGIAASIGLLIVFSILIGAVETLSSYHSLLAGTAVGLLISCIALLVVSPWMPRKTAYGRELYQRALGYKLFVSGTEKYRARFFENEGTFTAVLPYAIMFGVTDKLAQAFKEMGIEPKQPAWYHGTGTFHAAAFAANMNDFSTSLSTAMASAPSSSGSGGGGFSGGGFGGGGGGSW